MVRLLFQAIRRIAVVSGNSWGEALYRVRQGERDRQGAACLSL